MHNVFKNDPLELKGKVNRKARIETKDNRIFEGIIYTVDPVSESICFCGEDGSLSIIFPHSIKSLELSETVEDFRLNYEQDPNKEALPENLAEQKYKLKNWLLKNMIPVTEQEDSLYIGDQLFITPPYKENNCISTNEVALSKIKSLIRKMDEL